MGGWWFWSELVFLVLWCAAAHMTGKASIYVHPNVSVLKVEINGMLPSAQDNVELNQILNDNGYIDYQSRKCPVSFIFDEENHLEKLHVTILEIHRHVKYSYHMSMKIFKNLFIGLFLWCLLVCFKNKMDLLQKK